MSSSGLNKVAPLVQKQPSLELLLAAIILAWNFLLYLISEMEILVITVVCRLEMFGEIG